MKKLLFISFYIFIGTLVFAQTDSSGKDSGRIGSAKSMDTAGMAKIFVIRSTGFTGSAVNLRVLLDDMMLCKIKNNHYAVFYVTPGTHTFNATSWDKPGSKKRFGLTMPVEAGKEYYMSMRIKTKFIETEIFLEEITFNSAAPQLQKYKIDECD